MLAVQTEHDNLYVPDLEIASLTPVHPNRTRVVLADGTVAYRPGPPPPGPWRPLGSCFVNPEHLIRDGDHWRDPADYLYPYQPLEDLEFEEEPTDLNEDLICFEMHNHKYFWRSDSGTEPCPLKPDQALQAYPQLCQIGRSHLVNMRRVRRFGPRLKGGWIELDNGERFEFGMRIYYGVAQALGSQSLAYIDREYSPQLLRLRDLPYHLTSADPDRIRQDCPTPQSFLYNVLWLSILQHHGGQANDHGRNLSDYLEHPLNSAGQRCCYQFTRKELTDAVSYLVHEKGVFQMSDLGWTESDTSRRIVGVRRPEVLLVAAHKHAKEARKTAEKSGISLLLAQPTDNRLSLEYLAARLPSPIYLIYHQVEDKLQRGVQLALEFLDHTWLGKPIQLEKLDQLPETLNKLPKPYKSEAPEAFRRIPLQARRGVVQMVEPEDIAAWSPVRFNRWRVVLKDGQVLHHPGPVPPGPGVAAGEHRVQPHLIKDGKDPAGFQIPDTPKSQRVLSPSPPADHGPALPCPPDQVLWLEAQDDQAVWHLQDGRPVTVPMSAEEASSHHPGLVRLTRGQWVHHNRIRLTKERSLELDSGQEFLVAPSRHTHRLKQVLGIPAFDTLAPDYHGLQLMGLRDYSFEIYRAPEAVLYEHFRTPNSLLFNIMYQSYVYYQESGVVPYGDTLSGYYYRPLQSTLYRGGFITEAQFLAKTVSNKDKLYQLFLRLLHAMVYHHRIFTYESFGLKDPYPQDRLIGIHRPHQILLVEKGDKIEDYGQQLQAEFGLTLHILQGMPSLMSTEFFAKELKSRGLYRVEIFFYGDFDVVAWDIGPAFIKQLRFYGIECTRLERLVLPDCFTPEELGLFSRPIDIPNSKMESRLQRWLRECGGLNGQPRGIHANHFLPYPRIQARLEQLLK
jgi:hypothetical protein